MVQPLQIRAKFYKLGMLQYISHLDLVRTMTRNLVRAGIPAWYTQGFNPRLKLTFSLPLSIGTQSECEFFDIKLIEHMELDEVKRRINETLTEEMQITDVYISDKKFTDIAYAKYEIVLVSPRFTEETASALKKMYSEPLVVLKRSKSGEKEIDISPFIDLNFCEYTDGKIKLDVLLSADNANYINPEYLIKAAQDKLGINFEDPFLEYYTIKRLEVYLSDKKTIFR